MNPQINPHVSLPEPLLAFHPERTSDQGRHPLRGLLDYGPYSAGFVPDPIRIATLAPHGESQRIFDFIKNLNSVFDPRERRDYLPRWPGFKTVFGLQMRAAGMGCHHEISSQLDKDMDKASQVHITIANHLVRAIQRLEARQSDFDVLFIFVSQRWEPGFRGGPNEDFDLHDHLKAYTAMRGMPIQLVREDKAVTYHCKASVMWRIGLALYAKAGGVPWKLAESDPEIAYIGISYAVRPRDSAHPRFVTCCSQVFDADGAGLEFVAYDAREVELHRDNPFLSQTEMFRVMTRSMDLYRRRHAGRTPRRIMVHKTTEFKHDEVTGCMEALHLCETVDLGDIVKCCGWRRAHPDGLSGGFDVSVLKFNALEDEFNEFVTV